MSEYAETMVNIVVFMRLPFFCFFTFSVSDGRLWDVIWEGFEGPVLPSGPAGHAGRLLKSMISRQGSRILRALRFGG